MTEKQKGIIALLLVALAWGILPIFPRFLNHSFSLYQQLYLRIGAGFFFSLVFFHKSLRIRRITHIPVKDSILLILRAISYWMIGAGLMTSSLLITTVSNVMFIQSLPATVILGAVLFHEKFTIQKIILIALSFIGVLLVSVSDVSGLVNWGMGEVLSLFSIFAFGFSIVSRKWHTDYLSDRELSTYTLFFAFMFTLIASIVFNEGNIQWNGDMSLIGIIVVSGVIIAGMNFFLNFAYKRVEAIVSGPILSLETVLAIIFAYFIFHEVPSAKACIGGSIILLSAMTMQIVEYKKKK